MLSKLLYVFYSQFNSMKKNGWWCGECVYLLHMTGSSEVQNLRAHSSLNEGAAKDKHSLAAWQESTDRQTYTCKTCVRMACYHNQLEIASIWLKTAEYLTQTNLSLLEKYIRGQVKNCSQNLPQTFRSEQVKGQGSREMSCSSSL